MPATAPSVRSSSSLLAEIGAKGDFPATGRVVQKLRETVGRENCTALDIARVIMQDPGFSSKVLRLVNSAVYRQRGNPVSTISRAVILLGFGAIRDLTTGLMLMEEFIRKGRGSEAIREEVRRSLFCGLLSQAIASRVAYPSPEEAYLLGLFANLGRLWLCTFYPAEHARASVIVEERGVPFARAAAEVVGVAPSELSAAVLEHWNFPPVYPAYFRRSHAGGRQTTVSGTDRLGAIVDLAAECAAGEDDAVPTPELLRRFQGLFSAAPDVLLAAVEAASESLREHGHLFGLSPKRTADDPAAPSASERSTEAPETPADGRRLILPATVEAGALAIVADIAHSMLDKEAPGDTLAVVLEGIARLGRYDVVLLTVLDPAAETLVGTLAYGDAAESLKGVAVPLQPDGGLLAETGLALAPRLVAHGTAATLVTPGAPAPRVPAGSFITYPLATRGRLLGVLLAVRVKGPAVADADLGLVRLLAQQASLVLERTAG